MQIKPINPNVVDNKVSVPDGDPYELDIQAVRAHQENDFPHVDQLVRSWIFCTPGCAKHGTFNSFCC